MANGTLKEHEAKWEAKFEALAVENSEFREAIAVLESEQSTLKSENEKLKTAVAEVEKRKAPSPAAYWGPAVSSVTAIAFLAVFVLNERVDPIKQNATDSIKAIELIKEINAAQEKELEWHKSWINSLQQAITKVDTKVNNLRVKQAEEDEK
jgi:prefoldin subunit 5